VNELATITPKRILIAGCGDVGTLLGLALNADGHEVFGLRRDPAALPPGITPVTGDLTDRELGDALPSGMDCVVYTAAPSGRSEEAYRAIYVDGVRNVLNAVSREGTPERVLLLSSTAVYGDAGGDWVDEDTPLTPEENRGGWVLEGEHLVLSHSIPGTVLRLGGIYGPGRTWLIDRVRSGAARIPAGGTLWTNRIHRDDAAGAARHLLSLDAPPPVVLGVDDAPSPLHEVMEWLARELGVEPPPVDPNLTRDRGNKRCSNARLRRTGYAFKYPTYREGYRPLIDAVIQEQSA
jgi:nucleoside-diphosphate-sugar epimerase